MKRKILISINPEYVDQILSGAKRYEYRTKAAKQDVQSIIIYETYPVKRVVAEADIIEVLAMKPSDLWELTKKHSGTSKIFFDEYFKGREIAYAYRLGEIRRFPEPLSLAEFGLRCAPQSFVYLN